MNTYIKTKSLNNLPKVPEQNRDSNPGFSDLESKFLTPMLSSLLLMSSYSVPPSFYRLECCHEALHHQQSQGNIKNTFVNQK